MAVVEGLAAIAQGILSDGVANNIWYREPKISFFSHLAGEMGKGPKGTEIGRPSGADVFKGTKMTKADRLSIQGMAYYEIPFAISNPTNVTILGSKDSSTQLPSWTSVGGTQADIYGLARVYWTGMLDEEILIPREHYNRAMTAAGTDETRRGIARQTIVKNSVRIAQQNILSRLANGLQNGAPTDQDADPMDDFIGFATWFSATNYCAGVDRGLAKNAQFRALVDATAYTPSATTLVDAANLGPNYLQNKTEDGAVAFFVNDKCFKAFKAELLGLGFSQIIHSIPEMAAAGATNKFVLQKDNCYFIYDRSCPANTAYCVTPATWAFITHPDYNFHVTEFQKLWELTRGAPQAMMAHVELRGMFVCTNPGLNILFNGFTDPS
jgi:hypothetical protein